MPNVYNVQTSLLPGVTLSVDQAEYQRLTELDLVDALLSVTADPNQVIVQPTTPPAPAVGTVWVNNTV